MFISHKISKMRKVIAIIFFVLLSVSWLKSQDSVYIVTGKVIDGETLVPVPMVFLLNTAKMYGVQTDTSGKFRMLMTRTDSIRISSIGYQTMYWKPDFADYTKKRISINIYLVPQTYSIGAVNIYDVRWSSFVQKVSETKQTTNSAQQRVINWVNKIIAEEELSKINPVTALSIPLPIATHREKMLKKIEKQKRLDKLNKLAYEKFNPKFVSEITGLEGTELKNFMTYCKFERNFILSTSKYDLIIIVEDIFKEYKLLSHN